MKPILFNTDMVRAITRGKKTETRRKIPQRLINRWKAHEAWQKNWSASTEFAKLPSYAQEVESEKDFYNKWENFPYQIGEMLYVRETWVHGYYACGEEPDGRDAWYVEYDPECSSIVYKAQALDDAAWFATADDHPDERIPWRPSIHMRKEDARLFLRVTDIYAERLQDITNKGCIAEGCEGTPCFACHGSGTGGPWGGCPDCAGTGWQEPPLLDFMSTWESTIKETEKDLYGWEANPWVWVIKFEVAEDKYAEHDFRF